MGYRLISIRDLRIISHQAIILNRTETMHPRLQDVPLENRTPRPEAKSVQIQLRRNRTIELDREAKLRLSEVWGETELVLLRLQRELAVEEGDDLMALAYVRALAKIKDEWQAITIEGEKIKKEENK